MNCVDWVEFTSFYTFDILRLDEIDVINTEI